MRPGWVQQLTGQERCGWVCGSPYGCALLLARLMEKSKFVESELLVLYRRFHNARFYTAKRTVSQSGTAGKDGSSGTTADGRLDLLLFYNFLVRLTR